MDFRAVVARRRMVRRYRPDPVEAESLDRIVDAARTAPTAGFSQGVELVVVTSQAGRERLAAAAREDEYRKRGFAPWLSAAPVHIIVACRPDTYRERYGKPDKSKSVAPDEWPAPYWWVDAGAALMMVLLAATNEGLAAGFLGSHAFNDLAAVVGLPDEYEPIGLVTIGTADHSDGTIRPRRPLAQFDHDERWGVPRRPEPAP